MASKTLFNVDHQAVVLDHAQPGVQPGEAHTFTPDEIKAGLSGSWSDKDPRAGLKAEREFKQRRDKAAQTESPAKAGEQGGPK